MQNSWLRGGLSINGGTAFALAVLLSLGGCASLPSSGPTGSAIRKGATVADSSFPYALVNLDSASALPAPPARAVSRLAEASRRPTDLLGAGDVINVTIYEAGVTLFGGSPAVSGAGGASLGLSPASTAERLPTMRISTLR